MPNNRLRPECNLELHCRMAGPSPGPDPEGDRGPILAQSRVPVLPDDSPDRLAARVLEVEHRLLPAVVLAAAAAGRPVPLPAAVELSP